MVSLGVKNPLLELTALGNKPESSEYEDLGKDNSIKMIALNLKKSDRYYHGPTPV